MSLSPTARAHPLGNFTVNHYSRVEVGNARLRVRYIVDMAEIAAFQELQQVDANADGKTSDEELDAYVRRTASQYASNLIITVDGARVPLSVSSQKITLPAGEGGLPTLRVESDFVGGLSPAQPGAARRLQFKDANHEGRIGWHEIVITPASGVNIFNSSAYGNGLTDELKEYPEDMLTAPLNERAAELSFTTGAALANAQPLRMRDGRPVAAAARDRFAELINVPELTPGVALFGLLLAAVLGGFHALSPGHGKAVVAAYLVGSRGTAKHAVFLGLTVTITHTAGVIALGLATLFASQYIVPEKLFPVLSLVSGAIVVVIGFSLFVRRLAAALGLAAPEHHHHHDHEHTHDHSHGVQDHVHHEHSHAHGGAHVHSHGGREHSHLPPGTDGTPVTWRSLLALGVSGGLLPCPSALVVMLSAITLGRVGYGLILVVAFSVGLASVL
ncbi:MAG: nickel/cobalt transporter, partial [Pyrinomonadaceae bacterium]